MKKLVLIFGVFLMVFSSCQEEQGVKPEEELVAEKSEAAKNSLNIIASMKDFNGFGIGKPSLFTNGVGISASGRSGSRQLTTARILGDSTDNGGDNGGDNPGDNPGDDGDPGDDDWDWTTCAEETFTENADGSYTWSLDYGDEGCEDYGYFMKGKLIETYSEDGNTFSSSVEYINFGDNYFLMNGTSTYSGTWEESEREGDDFNGGDSTYYGYSYSGSYTYAEDMIIQITDSLEDGTVVTETYAIEAEGSESYDENGFTTNEGFTKYTLPNGDFYNTVITTPLFYSFACDMDDPSSFVFVHVSGVESTTWQESDDSGEFSVNYGDGSCDNIITVTENGESYDVDLSEEWEDDWEDDEDGNDSPNG